MNTPPPPPGPLSSGSGSGPSAPITNPLVYYWNRVLLENYAQFQGRARRAEFWWYTLGNVIVAVILVVLASIASIFWVLYVIFALAVIVPSIAVSVRRLHDTDKSAWYLLFYLIPFIGGIIMIVFWATDSTRGTNQYGTSEKYPA